MMVAHGVWAVVMLAVRVGHREVLIREEAGPVDVRGEPSAGAATAGGPVELIFVKAYS